MLFAMNHLKFLQKAAINLVFLYHLIFSKLLTNLFLAKAASTFTLDSLRELLYLLSRFLVPLLSSTDSSRLTLLAITPLICL